MIPRLPSNLKLPSPEGFFFFHREINLLVVYYKSKKQLKESIGQSLSYIETSVFGKEYKSNGKLYVANRPHLTGLGREFFAEVTMKDNKIHSVK